MQRSLLRMTGETLIFISIFTALGQVQMLMDNRGEGSKVIYCVLECAGTQNDYLFSN